MIVARPAPDVSVVIPAHNEAENLPILVEQIEAAFESGTRSFEIVVIDDHSSDETPRVLDKMQASRPWLVVRRMERQSGQSAAICAGFDTARGEILVTIDADLQNDPADIPALLDAIDGFDVAIGWRKNRRDTFQKRIISKVANRVRNWMTGDSTRDTGCGLKAFRRETCERMPRFDGMHRFFPILVRMQGFTVTQIPVNHRPRTRGKTHYNIFNRSIRPIVDLLAIRWLQKRAVRYKLQERSVRVPV